MSKFRDFQVSSNSRIPLKVANQALFATAEPVRLWVRARRFDAPFRKLVVSLEDIDASQKKDGAFFNVDGVCSVTVLVDFALLSDAALDHRWVLGVVKRALSRVHDEIGWRSDALEAHLDELSGQSPPLVYMFETLSSKDKRAGTTCVPWFRSRPGLFEIGVRVVKSGIARDFTVVKQTEPLYLEDTFPLAGTKIEGGRVLLLDKHKSALATVDIG